MVHNTQGRNQKFSGGGGGLPIFWNHDRIGFQKIGED